MSRFQADKYREEVLAAFLEDDLYSHIASDVNRVGAASLQKKGHDVEITFDWDEEPVVADEKAQNSDKWLNDPAPTFVMEIFGESWTRQGKPEWNIGWFVDEQNETECYVLVWLPNVSIFKVESGATDHPILTYQSADIVDFEPAALDEQSPEMVRWRSKDSESDVRVELSPAGVSAFESVAEPIPDIITSNGAADEGEWYYEPQHIHEAKVAVVRKESIRDKLNEEGLTRDVLLQKGKRAIKEYSVAVESSVASRVMRSGGPNSGSGRGENPVILVVPYSTYHELAEETFHYREQRWTSGVRLF